ncbi:hypothetical protein HYFRA_00001860 [Hymenoscyphus fraxineus]|uniref:Uncharacterized protein n=1 Tax=Hymenoscyphus fraxineus TaxID=746836 RepID=A0A9N9PE65_9HELO|nr:hypothetical protein HYFRA_00001860 [Hymenoscyphus fraxineus]
MSSPMSTGVQEKIPQLSYYELETCYKFILGQELGHKTRNADDLLQKACTDPFKRKFLDRVAQLFSNNKGGKHVTATALVQRNTGIFEMFVARNKGFQNNADEDVKDFQFARRLQESLRRLSRPTIAMRQQQKIERTLWNRMVAFYIPRLQAYHKAFDKSLPTQWRLIMSCMSNADISDDLRDDLVNLHRLTKPETAVEKHGLEFVDTCNRIYRGTNDDTMKHCLAPPEDWMRIRSLIGYIGRLRECHRIIIHAAKRLSLSNLEIKLLSAPPQEARPERKYDFIGYLQELGVLGSWTTQSATDLYRQDSFIVFLRRLFVGRKHSFFNRKTIDEMFEAVWGRGTMDVHAEIQLVLHLSELGITEPGYIGCSKYSCVTCYRYMHAHGQFTTIGCHQRLFNMIPIPANKLQMSEIAASFWRIQDELANHLRTVVASKLPEGVRGGDIAIASSNSILPVANLEGTTRHPRRNISFSSQSTIGDSFPFENLEYEVEDEGYISNSTNAASHLEV